MAFETDPTMPRDGDGADTGAHVPLWERQLRAALAGSSEAEPRPIVRLELPLNADRLIKPEWFSGFKRAAVLVPIFVREQGPTVLLTRRSESLRSHKGQIAFPGGRRDDTDVSAVDNALREAEEEIGLPRQHVEVIGYLDDYPTITRYRVTPVVGIVREPPELHADAAEVATIFEVPLSLLLDSASYERKFFVRENVKTPFFEVLFDEHRIWGATAGMLRNFCETVELWRDGGRL